MKNPSGRIWTEDEVELLLEDGPKRLSIKELAELIERTKMAINSKLTKMRNQQKHQTSRREYNSVYYARHGAGKMRSLTKARWTAEELRMISAIE